MMKRIRMMNEHFVKCCAALLAVMLAASPALATSVFLNGTKIDGVTGQKFENVTVELDASTGSTMNSIAKAIGPSRCRAAIRRGGSNALTSYVVVNTFPDSFRTIAIRLPRRSGTVPSGRTSRTSGSQAGSFRHVWLTRLAKTTSAGRWIVTQTFERDIAVILPF